MVRSLNVTVSLFKTNLYYSCTCTICANNNIVLYLLCASTDSLHAEKQWIIPQWTGFSFQIHSWRIPSLNSRPRFGIAVQWSGFINEVTHHNCTKYSKEALFRGPFPSSPPVSSLLFLTLIAHICLPCPKLSPIPFFLSVSTFLLYQTVFS